MRRWLRAVVVFAGFVALSVPPAHADSRRPVGMKLYVFTSSADRVPAGFYPIRHPRGNVVFDATHEHAIVNRDAWWGPLARAFGLPSVQEAMDGPLARVGLRAADIKYVVLGDVRFNYDRIVQAYRSATVVVARHVDLFDDRGVEIVRAPGAVPRGHMAIVRLPRTGTVVLRDHRLADGDSAGIFRAHVPTSPTAPRQAPDYYE
jgi:hypothetical protein